MTARLHVLLGAGGVGKTTLAAGYALALARAGGRVGVFGIDPSRRLQDALGLPLSDVEIDVLDAPGLRAASMYPHQALRRWVADAGASTDEVAALEHNPFFTALGDKLATAIDMFAAVRIAEWVERDPALTDLVVDTAPGIAAVDFLRDPREVADVAEGPAVRWFRAAAAVTHGGLLRTATHSVVRAFGRIAGTQMVEQLSQLFAAVGPPLERVTARLETAAAWMRRPDTELLLVTSPRDAAAWGARRFAAVLRDLGLAPHAVVVNRTLPPTLVDELAAGPIPAEANAVVGYIRSMLAAQAAVLDAAAPLAPVVVTVASDPALDRSERDTLVEIGDRLVHALARAAH